MNPVTLVSGFVPLALFAILDGHLAVAAAALVAAGVAVVIAIVTPKRVPPTLAVVQGVTLLAIAVLALVGGSSVSDFLHDYGRGIASLTLAAYILVTAGFAPFTAGYARAEVPPEVWRTPAFLRTNRRISAAWGAAITVMGLSNLLYAALGGTSSRGLLLSWGPTVLAVLAALRYTKSTIGAARTGDPDATIHAGWGHDDR